jgi:hypothetical protein
MTIHPQKELTKFGYKSKRKIEKKNPSTIWQLICNLLFKCNYFKFFLNLQNLTTLVHYFS